MSGVCDCEGVCEDGVCADGVCCEEGGISGEGGCWVVEGVCCDWVLSGAVVDGVDWAFSLLPQEIIPSAIARVARDDRDKIFFTNILQEPFAARRHCLANALP